MKRILNTANQSKKERNRFIHALFYFQIRLPTIADHFSALFLIFTIYSKYSHFTNIHKLYQQRQTIKSFPIANQRRFIKTENSQRMIYHSLHFSFNSKHFHRSFPSKIALICQQTDMGKQKLRNKSNLAMNRCLLYGWPFTRVKARF